jgi:hypothetical protein
VTDPVKLKGKLPENDRSNGLWHMGDELAKRPRVQRVVIAIVDVMATTIEHEVNMDGEAFDVPTPMLRVLSIEPVDGDDATAARMMLARARDARQGRVSLFSMRGLAADLGRDDG